MFVQEMSETVAETHKTLETCFSGSNVAMVVTKNLLLLKELAERIDPDKSGVMHVTIRNRRRIKKYWDDFEITNAELESLYQKLEKNRKIIANTEITLKAQMTKFTTAYEAFREIADNDPSDTDLKSQHAVTKIAYDLLRNTLTEYQTLLKKTDSVLLILKQSLKTAVILAKQKQSADTNSLKSFRESIHALSKI